MEFVRFFLIVILVGLVQLTIFVCFLLTLQIALGRCNHKNRKMAPAVVWLNLIPVLSIYWMFRTVFAVSDSLRTECVERDLGEKGDCGRSVGIWYVGTNLTFYAMVLLTFIGRRLSFEFSVVFSYFGFTCTIATWVLLVVYWVKVAGCSSRLRRDDLDGDQHEVDDEKLDRPRRTPTPDDRIQ